MDNSPTEGGEPKENMADDTKDKNASSDKVPEEKGKQTEKEPAPSKKEWEELVGDKFKSETELAKAYKELETKFGETSEEIRKAREFAEVINPLLEEIRNDPEIFNKLDEKLRKKGQLDAVPGEAEAKGDDKTEEMRVVAQKLILAKFEDRHGISKLSPDEQKKLRNRIGDVIYSLTGKDFDHQDLRRLDDVLENSLIIANKDSLIDKSKLEALMSEKGVEEGGIPGIPSSPGKAEETLTPEEATIADKLGLSREQYLAGKKSPAK